MLSTDYAKSKNERNTKTHKALKEILQVLPELKNDIKPTTYIDSRNRFQDAYELSEAGIKYLEMYISNRYKFYDYFRLPAMEVK